MAKLSAQRFQLADRIVTPWGETWGVNKYAVVENFKGRTTVQYVSGRAFSARIEVVQVATDIPGTMCL